MRINQANTLVYNIRVHATNLMTATNMLRTKRDKWDKIDAGSIAEVDLPPDLMPDIAKASQDFMITSNRLQSLRDEWDALDAVNTITNEMLGGDNDGITVTQTSSVIGTTLNALIILLDAGHGTNLYKLDVPDDDLTKTEVSAVIGTTLDAVNTFMDSGHATNCYTIRV